MKKKILSLALVFVIILALVPAMPVTAITNVAPPVAVTPDAAPPVIALVSAGDLHSAAICTDGNLWTWGRNTGGQLGIGTTGDSLTPVRVPGDITWASVSAERDTTFAICENGNLWTLRSGFKRFPSIVDDSGNWASLSSGNSHTLAIRTDGSLWAWGRNDTGQLGDGTNANRVAPVRIGTAYNWASVSAGRGHSAAIRTDGSLWTWGRGDRGELGNNTAVNSNTPVRVGSANNWASVSAGGGHVAAIRTDGSLWIWGWNGAGQLGEGLDGRNADGSRVNRHTPIRIGADAAWASVSAGYSFTLAIRTDGSLWGWGLNFHAQLGDGTNTPTLSPIRIGTDTDWASLSSTDHTVAIRTDGSVWTWGRNDGRGSRLGNGTVDDARTPMHRNNTPARITFADAPGLDFATLVYRRSYAEPFSITSEAGYLVFEIPAHVNYFFSWIYLDDLTQEWHLEGERSIRRSDSLGNRVVFSLAGVPDGRYILHFRAAPQVAGYLLSNYYTYQITVLVDITNGIVAFHPTMSYANYRNNAAIRGSMRTDDAALAYFLLPSEGIQSDHPEIIALAQNITANIACDYAKAKALHDWVANNIWYDSDVFQWREPRGDQSALTTLQLGRGVCEGYARLLAALLRAAGIPAKYILGYTSLGQSGGMHAWNEAFAGGRWIMMDATWNSANSWREGEKTNSAGLRGHRFFDATPGYFANSHVYFPFSDFRSQPPIVAYEDIAAAISLGLMPEALQSDYTQYLTRSEFAALMVPLYERVIT